MKIEILNKFTKSVIFTHEISDNTAKITVLAAIKENANLSRADLSGADLYCAKLTGAKLTRANLSGANYGIASLSNNICQILGKKWSIIIFDYHIKIGCKLYLTVEWEEFTDDQIQEMDNTYALEFWHKNKSAILAVAKSHQKYENDL